MVSRAEENAFALPPPRKVTAYFGAIPFRAFPDPTLTELDKSILGVVAAHDSMSLLRGGDGCYAGVDRIAQLANANPSNVSASLTKLVSKGYVRRDRHPRDGRRSTFRVIYNEVLDRGAFKGETLPAGKRLRGGALPDDGEMSRLPGESILPKRESVSPSPSRGPLEMLTSSGEYIEDTQDNLKIPSDESALAMKKSVTVGATLARLERGLKDGRIPPHEFGTWALWLEDVSCTAGPGDPNVERAQRLLMDAAFAA